MTDLHRIAAVRPPHSPKVLRRSTNNYSHSSTKCIPPCRRIRDLRRCPCCRCVILIPFESFPGAESSIGTAAAAEGERLGLRESCHKYVRERLQVIQQEEEKQLLGARVISVQRRFWDGSISYYK
ncbi:hypothetical protein Drorol1_Dr00004271 [Drosera rotundifolia]